MLRDGAGDDGSGSGDGGSAESAGGAGGGISDDAWVEPNVVADPSRGGRYGPGGGDDDDEEELQLGGGARRLLGGEGGATDQDGVAAGLGAIQLVESHFTSPAKAAASTADTATALQEAARETPTASGAIADFSGSGEEGKGSGGGSAGAGGGIGAGGGMLEDEDCPDLDSYVEDNLMQGDEATVQAGGVSYLTAQEPDDPILPTRSYDLSITYDKHHQTPRMFLFGYDESGQPLSAEEVFEDVMQDYARQTVTMEPHPHLSSHHASVHPCKHASTMKIMLENLTKGGKEARVDQYLFIFLKFIQSVVPTIDYDYTMSVDAGGGNNNDTSEPDLDDAFVDVAETSP
ncbi:unnamed protein product [Ectocarpus sp. 13 AM-2016]